MTCPQKWYHSQSQSFRYVERLYSLLSSDNVIYDKRDIAKYFFTMDPKTGCLEGSVRSPRSSAEFPQLSKEIHLHSFYSLWPMRRRPAHRTVKISEGQLLLIDCDGEE